jgi:hypothetical protein
MPAIQAPRTDAAVATQARSAAPQGKRQATAKMLSAAARGRGALGASETLALQAVVGNRAMAELVRARKRSSAEDLAVQIQSTEVPIPSPYPMPTGPATTPSPFEPDHQDARSNEPPGIPGPPTLVESLAPVQLPAGVVAGAEPAHIHAAAQRGIAGGFGPLPHLGHIQPLFGRHDVSRVKAHVGDEASAASHAMGAAAFATGDHVAFGSAPDLYTAAHEAAHVVQQRSGVHLRGGVGQTGDVYEQHADQVADRVVAGQSAEALLDRHSAAGGTPAPAVQRRPITLTGASAPIETSTYTLDDLKDLLKNETAKTVQRELRDAIKAKEYSRKRPVTMTAVKDTIAEHQKKNKWDFATGHSSSGMWPEDVTVRGEYKFQGERVRQVLRHISTMIFHYVKSKVKDEQEVQAMLVNNRIFVSSNDRKSMALFSGSLQPEDLFEILLDDTALHNDSRAMRDMNKLRALVAHGRIYDITTDPTEASELESMQRVLLEAIADPAKHVKHCSIEGASRFITDANADGQLIFVDGLDKAHAEQNLIIAYAHSGSTDPAQIFGKKRPCTGCYLTFVYATKILGLKITHSANPGGFWGPAVPALVDLMTRQKATIDDVHGLVTKHLPSDVYRTKPFGVTGHSTKKRGDTKQEETGYDSGSESEIEDWELTYKDLGF